MLKEALINFNSIMRCVSSSFLRLFGTSRYNSTRPSIYSDRFGNTLCNLNHSLHVDIVTIVNNTLRGRAILLKNASPSAINKYNQHSLI